MSSTTLVRAAAARSLFLAPLLAAGLVLGTGAGTPSSMSSEAPEASTALADGAGTTKAANTAPVTIKAQPVAVTYSTRQLALRITAAQKGDPYRYGAEGPSSFDCSGLVYYVYRTKLGRYIPRTANDQRLKSIPLAKSQKRAGDLIFFMSGGRAYHVGVYAGDGYVWHAPYTGSYVKKQRIWTTAYAVGRVR